jgi:hypothetical protein
LVHILGQKIRLIVIFGMLPHHFDRVQVQRITGQPFDLTPADLGLTEQVRHLAVNYKPIPNQDELPAQVTMDLFEKGDHFWGTNMGSVQFKIQSYPMPPREESRGRNRRQAILAIPIVLDRGMPPRSPGAPHQRLQNEATLVGG